jgi:hypothetical protein
MAAPRKLVGNMPINVKLFELFVKQAKASKKLHAPQNRELEIIIKIIGHTKLNMTA